jgi:5-methylcytosine-specific restriction endonuclease McrA
MPRNIVHACKQCNNAKGNMDVETYRQSLQDNLPAGERIVFYGEQCPQPWFL